MEEILKQVQDDASIKIPAARRSHYSCNTKHVIYFDVRFKDRGGLGPVKNYFEMHLKDFNRKNQVNILQYLFLFANNNLYIYILHIQVFNCALPDFFDA